VERAGRGKGRERTEWAGRAGPGRAGQGRRAGRSCSWWAAGAAGAGWVSAGLGLEGPLPARRPPGHK